MVQLETELAAFRDESASANPSENMFSAQMQSNTINQMR